MCAGLRAYALDSPLISGGVLSWKLRIRLSIKSNVIRWHRDDMLEAHDIREKVLLSNVGISF